MQDALLNAAEALDVQASKRALYAATLPSIGNTKLGVISDYAESKLGIRMLDTKKPETLGQSLFRMQGGPEFALLQQRDGVFFVELEVAYTNQEPDRHAVAYDATHNVVIDNWGGVPVKFVEDTDRSNTTFARALFKSLFSMESPARVSVVGAHLARCM